MAYRPKNVQERIIHRLKIAQGHLKKVQEMVEKDQYCVDIINQSRAVQSALEQIDTLLLEHHLHGCVTAAITEGRNEEAIAEVMQVFAKRK